MIFYKDLIVILMAAYNGEKYVAEQIESILNQTYKEWVLIIRDDNSTDNTPQIIKKYAMQNKQVVIIEDELGNLGPLLNFNQLMKHAISINAPYIMFSDQDDLWFPNKIYESYQAIKHYEKSNGKECPILVYTNYCLSNRQLPLKNKVYAFQNVDNSPNQLLVQNWILGCTMIFNAQLLNIAMEVPYQAINHDNWVAIIASLTGKIGYLNVVTLSHRLHSENFTIKNDTSNFLNRARRVITYIYKNRHFFETKKQFYFIILNHLNGTKKYYDSKSLILYYGLFEKRTIFAFLYALKNKFYPPNTIQSINFGLKLLFKCKS